MKCTKLFGAVNFTADPHLLAQFCDAPASRPCTHHTTHACIRLNWSLHALQQLIASLYVPRLIGCRVKSTGPICDQKSRQQVRYRGKGVLLCRTGALKKKSSLSVSLSGSAVFLDLLHPVKNGDFLPCLRCVLYCTDAKRHQWWNQCL